MSQTCSKCSHVNPPEASYCYYDGAVLGGHGVNGGPVNLGSAPFPSQFVFPTGQACRNFDQLAMACQQNWTAAVDLLKQGYLASFLGGVGRVDLAMAAQEAARYPDQDRGLDQLLDKFPTQVLQKPKLVAEPSDINLGTLRVGTDRQFEMHLANQGMRLLYGSVVSDCKWLTLGEAPGAAQKLFQFGSEGAIHVQVRGQHLRAGNKALEGHLVVESNGGQATITVRVDVPVKPFAEGVLAGAISPRQIAEKAKAQPKEAAALFERGAVANWFKENGWTYPVQGPSAAGLGAVQQFFEALGLATAPKVEVTEKSLSLRGNIGQPLQATIEVKTQEKRPVYAHATTDVPWLDVGKTNLNGRIAIVNVVVPGVPNCPGETLQGKIYITANGNQRFVVPISLQVTGVATYPMAPPPGGGPAQPVYAQPIMAQPIPAQPILAQPVLAVPVAAQAVPYVTAQPVVATPVQPGANVPYVTAQPISAQPVSPVGVSTYPMAPTPAAPVPPATRAKREGERAPAWVHLAPAGVLLLLLLVILLRDFLRRHPPDGANFGGFPVDPTVRLQNYFEEAGKDDKGQPGGNTMRFGVIALDPKGNRDHDKQLTYDRRGRTNTTVVRVNGEDRMFGFQSGRWVVRSEPIESRWKGAGGTKSVWMFDENVKATQTVEIVPGDPRETSPGVFKRYLDTVLIRYKLENKDAAPRKVGLRFMLDTLIGSNDGVPFTVPGLPGLVDQMHDFDTPEKVPAFMQVLEKPDPDLHKAGLIAFLNFKVGGKIQPPDRVSVTRWPGVERRWDVQMQPMGDDSCVVMYWNERELKPGESREVGFTYGLYPLTRDKSGKMGLSVAGNFAPGGELTVVALVSTPQANQKLTLNLPDGFRFAEGQQATQDVPGGQGRAAPVTWRIVSSRSGEFQLEVTSNPQIDPLRKTVSITADTIFQ